MVIELLPSCDFQCYHAFLLLIWLCGVMLEPGSLDSALLELLQSAASLLPPEPCLGVLLGL